MSSLLRIPAPAGLFYEASAGLHSPYTQTEVFGEENPQKGLTLAIQWESLGGVLIAKKVGLFFWKEMRLKAFGFILSIL